MYIRSIRCAGESLLRSWFSAGSVIHYLALENVLGELFAPLYRDLDGPIAKWSSRCIEQGHSYLVPIVDL